jgi:exodeoxyribonuclease VII small subunit
MMSEPLDLNAMMKRIETLVGQLEEGSLQLEANLKAFEEANQLIKTIEKAIKEAELKIEQILENK